MFNKEILSIKNEIEALKRHQHKLVTMDDLIVKSITITSRIDDSNLNEQIFIEADFDSEEIPLVTINVERVSGEKLNFLYCYDRFGLKDKYYMWTFVVNRLSSADPPSSAITLKFTVSSLTPFNLSGGAF